MMPKTVNLHQQKPAPHLIDGDAINDSYDGLRNLLQRLEWIYGIKIVWF